MNASTYDGIEHTRYIWYTKREIRRKSKERALINESDFLIIRFMDNSVETYERHKTRWYRI